MIIESTDAYDKDYKLGLNLVNDQAHLRHISGIKFAGDQDTT